MPVLWLAGTTVGGSAHVAHPLRRVVEYDHHSSPQRRRGNEVVLPRPCRPGPKPALFHGDGGLGAWARTLIRRLGEYTIERIGVPAPGCTEGGRQGWIRLN